MYESLQESIQAQVCAPSDPVYLKKGSNSKSKVSAFRGISSIILQLLRKLGRFLRDPFNVFVNTKIIKGIVQNF